MVSSLCIRCKGKMLCGLKRCPLIVIPKKPVGKDFFGPSPSVFVGRYGYPDVFVGPMASMEGDAKKQDNPSSWFGADYNDIIDMRSMLMRTKHKKNVFSKERFIMDMQELAMSKRPADVEINFKNQPSYRMSFSSYIQPMGPTASIEKFSVAENVRISNKVEKIVNDEIKAQESSYMLYKTGNNVYKITTILSSGALGIEKKIVPTRWSITATDDIIFRNLIRKIKDFSSVNEYRVYSSSFLDNHFQILLMPGNWEYENFEAWSPGTTWNTGKNIKISKEYEPYEGRKKYAEEEGGGYYAARLIVAEFLFSLKRQARIAVFREIYEGYKIPLGVWVVRETVRNAFTKKPEKFSSLNGALNCIKSRLRVPLNMYISKSTILRQRRVTDF